MVLLICSGIVTGGRAASVRASFRAGRSFRFGITSPAPSSRHRLYLHFTTSPRYTGRRPPRGSFVPFVRSCSPAPSSRHHPHFLTSLPPPAPSAAPPSLQPPARPRFVVLLTCSGIVARASLQPPRAVVGVFHVEHYICKPHFTFVHYICKQLHIQLSCNLSTV